MWITTLTRSELVEIFGLLDGGKDPDKFRFDDVGSDVELLVTKGTYDLLWDKKPVQAQFPKLPAAIVCHDDELDDLLAWFNTFFVQFSPITSVIRILPERIWNLCNKEKNRRDLRPFESVILGAITGEVLAAKLNENIVSTAITDVEAFSTRSFVYSQLLLKFQNSEIYEQALYGWEWLHVTDLEDFAKPSVDSLNKQLAIAQSDEVFSVVSSLFERNTDSIERKILRRVLIEMIQQRDLSEYSLNLLSNGLFTADLIRSMSTARKEDRVRIFAEIAKRLPDFSIDGSFILGYFASVISEGLLSHLNLLVPFLQRFPSLVRWYAICCSIRSQSRFGGEHFHVNVAILKEFERPFSLSSGSSSDISLSEFRVLTRSQSPPIQFIGTSKNQIIVEIVPGILTLVSTELSKSSELSSSKELMASAYEQLGQDLDQEYRNMERIRQAYLNLGSIINSNLKPEFDRSKQSRPGKN